MWVYYSIILALFSVAWSFRRREAAPDFVFLLLISLMAIFTGFRYAVGCDYFSYQIHFGSQDSRYLFEFIPKIDPLYWGLIDLISFVGLPYEALNIITAIVFFVGFYYFSKMYRNPFAVLAFSFPVMIIALPMSATRQALAAGFIMFGFGLLQERRYFLFSVMVFVASQFHSSAALFFFLLPIVHFGGTLRAWFWASPFLILGLFLVSGTAQYELADTRYISGDNDAAGAVFRNVLLFSVGLYYHVYLRRAWKMEMPNSFALVNGMSILLIASLPLSFVVPTIADRYGQYFFVIAAAICSAFPYLAVPGRDRALLMLILIFSAFFLSWSTLSWQVQACYNPYQNWLFGFPDGNVVR
jgi:hypothetical protein